jgi:NAD(P)-dependent dehydrogenase (short-subunit alcohol dehydrogenase family)
VFLRAGGAVVDRLQPLGRFDAGGAPAVHTVVADISSREAAETVVRTAEQIWGRVDVLVNSAGITARNVDYTDDFEEKWDTVMRVNVKGTLLMCHAAVDAFRRRVHQQAGQPPPSAAAIVNLGSINSFVTYPPSLKLSDGFNPVRTS